MMDKPPEATVTTPGGEGAEVPSRGGAIGRFIILGPLGAGGMGVVLAAYDPDLDRKVAIKLLRPGRGDVRAEAQAMARLRHPNVVAVYEVGDGFVVMEHVEGQTLRNWLDETERPWHEILPMFLGAGDGLAAAHRAGIVHRDFKPDNVLVDRDGRARVADFGLVAAAPGAGTLAYMAPEQQRGDPCDGRADEFAFCVALEEALAGKGPEWLRAALRRGRAEHPDERWPTFEALLAVLRRDRKSVRRSAVAAGMALAVAATAFAVGRRQAAAPACQLPPDDVWTEPVRTRVRGSFVATGRSYAEDTFARIDNTMRARMDAWARAHRDACAATHVRHEQSESLLDLRMRCLERGHAEAATVVGLLADADGSTVDRAVTAVAYVADPLPCADSAALTAVVPPPADPAARREDGEIRLEAARVLALAQLGRGKESVAAGRALAARARALGQAPACAPALVAASETESRGGDLDSAIELGYAAVRAAEVAHDDSSRAQALSLLVFALGYRQHHFAEAGVLADLAEAAATRIGTPPRLLAELYHRAGSTLEEKGEHAAALARYVAELGFALRGAGWRSQPVSVALTDIAGLQYTLGRFSAARAAFAQSVGVLEEVVGPTHASMSSPLTGAGLAALMTGALEPAAEDLERAAAINDQAFGPENEAGARILTGLAFARMLQGRLDDARVASDRAVAVLERLRPDSPQLTEALDLSAQTAARQGRLDEALASAERAHALRARIDGPEHERTADIEFTIGNIQRRRGHLSEAHTSYEHVLSIFKKVLGPDHPNVAAVSYELAEVLARQGKLRDAVALCDRTMPLVEKGFGADSTNVVDAWNVCANVRLLAGDRAGALALAERADRSAQARHLGPELESEARFRHAQAAQDCALAREALALAAAVSHAEIEHWLAANRCR